MENYRKREENVVDFEILTLPQNNTIFYWLFFFQHLDDETCLEQLQVIRLGPK